MVRNSHGLSRGLFERAISGDAVAITELGIAANTLDEEGETILHSESWKGNTERVQFILRMFPNKNLLLKLNRSRQTALHLAVDRGNFEVVAVLIDAARLSLPSLSNVETDSQFGSFQAFLRQPSGQRGNTALHIAVLNDNVQIVRLLVQADPDDRHTPNDEGKTPIYIAAEKGFKDVVKEICTTCTALSLDGPAGSTTALHAIIQNLKQVRQQEGASDIIRMIIHAAKRWSNADFEALFCQKDELGSTVLQLAVANNCVDAVRLILEEDPAYQHGRENKRNGLRLLIFKAMDNTHSDDIVNLLFQTYQVGVSPDHQDVVPLILAIKKGDADSVFRQLEDAKHLVTFTEDNGWTALHFAVYHEFDSVLGAIIQAQEDVEHPFLYEMSTPFHVAVECGYTSTLIRLMQLWPALSSRSEAGKSPYIAVNKDGRNILHLAAAHNSKEMVQGILKYCPELYEDKIVTQQDINGDTPLHILISKGCFVPELIKYRRHDAMLKNKNNFTAWDMLYLQTDVVADQVLIKCVLDGIIDAKRGPGPWNSWNSIFSSAVPPSSIYSRAVLPSIARIKDVKLNETKRKMLDSKVAEMKNYLERYKYGINSQTVASALIITITFTVGFTMPGGLHQSGEINEGLTVLSKKTAFKAFMIFDAIALLLSTCSLFIYFIVSITRNLSHLVLLHSTTMVLNVISVMMMMLVFMTGTYVVLSHSPGLAIIICVIGSLFFVFVIYLLLSIVYDRQFKKKYYLDLV